MKVFQQHLSDAQCSCVNLSTSYSEGTLCSTESHILLITAGKLLSLTTTGTVMYHSGRAVSWHSCTARTLCINYIFCDFLSFFLYLLPTLLFPSFVCGTINMKDNFTMNVITPFLFYCLF